MKIFTKPGPLRNLGSSQKPRASSEALGLLRKVWPLHRPQSPLDAPAPSEACSSVLVLLCSSVLLYQYYPSRVKHHQTNRRNKVIIRLQPHHLYRLFGKLRKKKTWRENLKE
jgi:hypothetical protein